MSFRQFRTTPSEAAGSSVQEMSHSCLTKDKIGLIASIALSLFAIALSQLLIHRQNRQRSHSPDADAFPGRGHAYLPLPEASSSSAKSPNITFLLFIPPVYIAAHLFSLITYLSNPRQPINLSIQLTSHVFALVAFSTYLRSVLSTSGVSSGKGSVFDDSDDEVNETDLAFLQTASTRCSASAFFTMRNGVPHGEEGDDYASDVPSEEDILPRYVQTPESNNSGRAECAELPPPPYKAPPTTFDEILSNIGHSDR